MRTDSFKWTFTSSGAGGWHETRGLSEQVTFYLETNKDSTATVRFDTAPSTGSTSHAGTLGSTSGYTLSTGLTRSVAFDQPLRAVRPYVVGMSTGGVRVELVGRGAW